jgi:membrane protein required for colicin V production
MNVADLAIAAVIAISVLIGMIRGFVVEVVSLAVWIAAVALAMLFGPRVADGFAGSISLPSARIALGYAAVFVLALIVGAIVVYLLRKLVAGTGISGTDRLLGMLFGLARGAVVVVGVVLLLGFTPFPRDPWWRESRALPAFEELATKLSYWLPEGVRRYLDYKPPRAESTSEPPADRAAPPGAPQPAPERL